MCNMQDMSDFLADFINYHYVIGDPSVCNAKGTEVCNEEHGRYGEIFSSEF